MTERSDATTLNMLCGAVRRMNIASDKANYLSRAEAVDAYKIAKDDFGYCLATFIREEVARQMSRPLPHAES